MSDLPPLDQPQAYVVVGPNDQRGPYTMELLIGEVVAGRLSDATPVWWPGLADWTTMGGHPGVAAEIAGRRSVPAAAPAWADPAAPVAPAPVAEPAPAPVAEPAPAADPFAPPVAAAVAEPAPVVEEPVVEEPVVEEPVVEPEPVVEEPVVDGSVVSGDDEIVDAEVIEVDEVVVTDGPGAEVFTALVARSAVRAELQGRIDAVNEQLIAAVTTAATDAGFDLTERVDVDRGAELRFDGADGDLVMVSLGRAAAARPEDLPSSHVPATVSYRSGARVAEASPATGAHGEVVVAADEWTGQSTSSVSLFLGLGDYLDEQLTVDTAALERDMGATIGVLRSRLA